MVHLIKDKCNGINLPAATKRTIHNTVALIVKIAKIRNRATDLALYMLGNLKVRACVLKSR